MFKNSWPLAMFAAVLAAPATAALAHEIVGNRFFPATLAIDDPGVTDELALPTISISKTGDDPSFKQLNVSAEFAKRITEDFAISIAPTWSRLYAPGGLTMNGARGFQNLATLFKYRLFKNDEHEFVMSAGLEIEWGGSGAQGVGAERFNVYTATIFFGKGFGDLPASLNWARPFAVTGQVGYSIPGVSKVVGATVDPDTLEQDIDTEYIPRVLNWGATLQYSMPYLKSAVVDLGLPDFINRMIPIVEASFQTPVSNTATSGAVTTGTINPGIIFTGKTYQVAVEAVIPVNRQSGTSVGIIGQLHFYLDDIFPNTLGRPIFASNTNTGRPLLGR
ncbi:MAG: hypothetical protein WCB74_06395 [Pseudolabrys sp.]